MLLLETSFDLVSRGRSCVIRSQIFFENLFGKSNFFSIVTALRAFSLRYLCTLIIVKRLLSVTYARTKNSVVSIIFIHICYYITVSDEYLTEMRIWDILFN